jgi:site-specific DNA-methyltransferase (adenine-specific)
MQELIEMSGEIGLICDPFMGSWTTARACKDLGRNFIGFELEEKYCKVGEERLRQELLF